MECLENKNEINGFVFFSLFQEWATASRDKKLMKSNES